ncbi:UDP-N-acetylmuramoyl-tripeptide--D-alanyl-D-alanine ligase [Moorena producens]|uniref:UDP-N-acetylmuramoyl-tripeptide--D-alanyl-D- alanine ligase n=1 Tax=Moorena producens TaxID=1155739 RepID=UPI003C728DA7
MVCRLLVGKLVDILAAKTVGIPEKILEKSFTGITTDTRHLEPGQLFLALRGEKFDGHDYAALAVEKGALAVIAEATNLTQLEGLPLIQVENTLKTYQQIARWWRDQFQIPVIAVTGSVGKTTTKELIAAVLSTKGTVLKTQANYNNEIGVPKTLLELAPDHDYAVIEMAMRGSGQIAELTEIANPTVGVITNVGTAHIGLLGSTEAIAKAKCELLAHMSNNGVAVLNHDNQRLIDTAAQVWQGQTITYGLEGGHVQGELIAPEILKVEGMEFPIPLPGRHNALNYLGALAIGKLLGVDWETLRNGLKVELPAGRAQRYELPNDVVILDETYNAGVESMVAALEMLAQTPGKRHIAVLGAMKELGTKSGELHQQVGQKVEQLNLDSLRILVDESEPEAEAIATGVTSVPVECFCDSNPLVEHLLGFVQPGDRLLFKASHSVGLDQVVKQFKAGFSKQD